MQVGVGKNGSPPNATFEQTFRPTPPTGSQSVFNLHGAPTVPSYMRATIASGGPPELLELPDTPELPPAPPEPLEPLEPDAPELPLAPPKPLSE